MSPDVPTPRPCPFCGGTDVYVPRNSGLGAVCCAACLGRGPSHWQRAHAIAAWNGVPECPTCSYPHEPQCTEAT